MKSILLILALTSIARADVFRAVVAVESGGDKNAAGDHGQARGLAQCHRGAWQDGCKALGVKWDYATGARDYAKCRAVFFAYASRYGAKTNEQRARCWNAGSGWKHKIKATNGYWAKVKKEMQRG